MRLGYFPVANGGRRRDAAVMTMYLSNADVRPTGYEAAEFIEGMELPAVGDAKLVPTENDDDGDSDGTRAQ